MSDELSREAAAPAAAEPALLRPVRRLGPVADLRFGLYAEVLKDVVADALITDPPYSARTHTGQRSLSRRAGELVVGGIDYQSLSEPDVHALVELFAPRTRRWWVMFGDHLTTAWALEHLARAFDWYTFPPITWEKTDAAPRFCADGPSPSKEWIAVARPRRKMREGERRYRTGCYRGPSRTSCREPGFVGQKPEWLMRAIVRDYSEPGDLVVDPFAGRGTTLVAARAEGRASIGAECDLRSYESARARLGRSYTPLLLQ